MPAGSFWLLKLLLLQDDLCEWAVAHLDPRWIQHSTVRDLVLRRLQAPRAETQAGATGLISELADDQARSLVTEALAESQPFPIQLNNCTMLFSGCATSIWMSSLH